MEDSKIEPKTSNSVLDEFDPLFYQENNQQIELSFNDIFSTTNCIKNTQYNKESLFDKENEEKLIDYKRNNHISSNESLKISPKRKKSISPYFDTDEVIDQNNSDMHLFMDCLPSDFQKNSDNVNVFYDNIDSNDSTLKNRIEELDIENNKLKNICIDYEEKIIESGPKLDSIIKEYRKRIEILLKERLRYLEEISDLQKVYQSNLKRYDELKKTIIEQREKEDELILTNKNLKKNLAEIASKIECLIQSVQDFKIKRENEINQLNVVLKVDALKIDGFEKSIEDLTHQKQQLTSICEELLNRHS